MTFDKLSIHQLEQDLEDLAALKAAKEPTLDKSTQERNQSYKDSYPIFIAYFKGINTIEKKHLVIASHFVYGWMPTILTLNLKDEKQVLDILNKAKDSNSVLGKEELNVLIPCINNSMVGTSKLLHFINPAVYAIWDSRIYRYFSENKTTSGIGNVKWYLAYVEHLSKLAQEPTFSDLHQDMKDHFGMELTPMRAIELVLFESIAYATKETRASNKDRS